MTDDAHARARALVGRRLRAGGGTRADEAVTPRADPRAPVPLSYAQRRLWLMEELFPATAAYHVPLAFRLRGPVDDAVLGRCLTEIVRRHEALRTAVGAGAVQRVEPARPVPLPVTDVGGVERARDLAGRRTRAPFDLGRGPLLRAELLRLAADDHVLLLVAHHLAADYWSLNVITEELSALYPALSHGRASPLPDPPVQYADFVVWERERARGEPDAAALAYWRRHLAGLAPLELPTDRPRPPVQTFDGARVQARLGTELTARLRALSRTADATLFMVLLAGFQAVLARWSGQDDVAVGSVSADRPRPELEPLVGFFINTLVLRGDLTGGPTFAELLRRTRQTTLAAHEHQGVPFDRLVGEVAPTGDLSRPPLFTVALSYLNAPDPRLRLPGVSVEDFAFDPGIVRFDLDVFLREDAGGVRLDVDYRTDLYDRLTVERLLDHVARLLDTASRYPQLPVAAITLSGPAELARLHRLGTNPVAHPDERPVPELVAEQARGHPQRIAVVDGQRELTYGELDRRAERLARRLRAEGAGRDVPVAVCLPRSAELVVALLAVLKAGSGYLPLDPDYPAQRLAFMLADSAAPILVTTDAIAGTLPVDGIAVIHPDEEPDRGPGRKLGNAPEAPATAPVPEPVRLGDLAYAIYTSGSTGRPKGVLIEHRGLLNLCRWHNRYHGVTPEDAASLLAAQSFDAAVWELWPYLVAGARVCVVDPAARTDPAGLAGWMRSAGITIAFLPTPLAELVLADDACADLPLRTLLTGGDALRRRPRPGLPFVLVNHYGPTECSVVATAAPVPDSSRARGTVPIGRPIDNIEAYLLDGRLHRVPLGTCGELYLGGAGLARGYLGRPDLTDERFVANPYGPPGSRLYRTGDLVRWRNDGTLEFLGRADRQVKVRGQRIEPGEVEARLVEHPDVTEAAVVAHPAGDGGQQLVGYLTAPAGRRADPDEVRGWLRARLPEAMVPTHLVVLDRLPLTPSGKLDRAALPDPAGRAERRRVAPRTDLEHRLLRVWAEVFERDPADLGVEDDFFDLGGHSLLAARLVGRIRQEFGVQVPLHGLFRARTIRRFGTEVLAPLVAQTDAEVTRRLLAHLNALPAEQAQRLLAAARRPAGRIPSEEDR